MGRQSMGSHRRMGMAELGLTVAQPVVDLKLEEAVDGASWEDEETELDLGAHRMSGNGHGGAQEGGTGGGSDARVLFIEEGGRRH